MVLHRDVEADGEASHEDDAEGEEQDGDDDVNPEPLVGAVQVGDGRVAKLDHAALECP